MGQIAQFSPRAENASSDTTTVTSDIWSIAKRLLAVLAVVAFSYAVFVAEVELAKSEQITEPYPR